MKVAQDEIAVDRWDVAAASSGVKVIVGVSPGSRSKALSEKRPRAFGLEGDEEAPASWR